MSDSEVKLEVTKEAQDQVRDLMKSQKPGMAVRVYLQSGGGGGGGGCGSGCSCGSGGGCGSEGGGEGGSGGGPSFGMAFDKPRNGDRVVKVDGFSIVVDDLSAEMLNGGRIDFVQDLNASGFKISMPNAPALAPESRSEAGGCGCGSAGCGGG